MKNLEALTALKIFESSGNIQKLQRYLKALKALMISESSKISRNSPTNVVESHS
jgi:hypothetical protein